MKKNNIKIDWTSKILDLLIVIIGITIAFRLNNWNESRKTDLEVKTYIKNFYTENKENHDELVAALKVLKSKKQEIDSLQQILTTKDYSSKRIKFLVASMASLPDFSPSTLTMQNITSSGKFDQIGSLSLRKEIISTYDAYKVTGELETLLSNYGNQYVTPFFFKNVHLINFSPIHDNFIKNPLFGNIVIGYNVLLTQLIRGFERNLKSVNNLDKILAPLGKS